MAPVNGWEVVRHIGELFWVSGGLQDLPQKYSKCKFRFTFGASWNYDSGLAKNKTPSATAWAELELTTQKTNQGNKHPLRQLGLTSNQKCV